jgi:AcrR family transcriptional regulator
MDTHPQASFEPRKTPVQARSEATVEAIFEATIQVLLEVGLDLLTTTRVAERAGVSVGTLYQYFPNKHSLLFSLGERHLNRVADAVVRACQRNHGQPVATMIESVVQAFVEAKMERADVSMALYATANGREATALVKKVGKRAQIALASMLATASDAQFADLPFTSLMLYSAMGGATRAVLEAGASPKMVRLLRKQLVLLGRGFLMNVATRRRSRGLPPLDLLSAQRAPGASTGTRAPSPPSIRLE